MVFDSPLRPSYKFRKNNQAMKMYLESKKLYSDDWSDNAVETDKLQWVNNNKYKVLRERTFEIYLAGVSDALTSASPAPEKVKEWSLAHLLPCF